MNYEQAKKLRVGDRVCLKGNPAHPDGMVITIAEIKEEKQTDNKPTIWFKDENGIWHWHKQHKVEKG